MHCRGVVVLSLVCASVATPFAGPPSPLRINGRVAAVVTPFNANGSVAQSAVIVAQSKLLTETGVDYVFVGGTTGESLSLALEERLALTEMWAPLPQKMIVHVGAESIVDVKKLTKHARMHGAVALGCMPSVFFKPANVDILAQWLKVVSEEAPELPLYYYHIPSMTGSTFVMLDLVKAVEKIGVPSFAGVKFTGLYETRAFMDMEQCMGYRGGKYEFLCGREEMTSEALSIGVKGFIGSQFNFAGDLYAAISAEYPKGQYLALQDQAQALLTLEFSVPTGVNAGKLLMEYAGIPMGPARLPNIDADAAARQAFFTKVTKWCSDFKKSHPSLPLAMCKKSAPNTIAV